MSGTIAIIRYIMFVVVILGAVGLTVILFLDGRKSKAKTKQPKSHNKQPKAPTNNEKGKIISFNRVKGQKVNIKTTQESLPFDTIEVFSPDEPIGIVAKNDGKTFIGVIEVQGINYNLLDIAERELLEKGFEMLLNGIDYPIQIFVQSRKIDIENYKKMYEDMLAEIKRTLDRAIERVNFYSSVNPDGDELKEFIENSKKLQSQYLYGQQLIDYIIYRCSQKNILERRYYIVLSHVYNPTEFKEELTKEEIVSNAFFDISNRANSIISALHRMKLDGNLLTGNELADLYYTSYNKADSEHYRMERALKSRFSHLYTTAEAVEVKAMRRRLNELKKAEEELDSQIAELQQQQELIELNQKQAKAGV